MTISIESVHLGSVIVIKSPAIEDERGFFMETFKADEFRALGLPHDFAQENHSGSKRGVLRGLHFQWEPPMGKLLRVTQGSAFLVAVDIRRGSPTLGKWIGMELSAQDRKQVWAPAGFARGLCVLSDYAEIQHKCTGIYNQRCESGILWSDPALAITWPVTSPQVSPKDGAAQTLAHWLTRQESHSLTY